MVGIGIGILSKRKTVGFPFALRSFWQRVRDDGGTMFDFNSAISVYRSAPTATLALSPSAGKAGTLYSVLPEGGAGDFTVSRTTSKVITNKDGNLQTIAANVPPISYDGGVPVINPERQTTQLLTRPISFDRADWTKSGATVTSGFPAPAVDGSGNVLLDAYKLVESSDNVFHLISPSSVSFSGEAYTVRVFAKKEKRSILQINTNGSVNNTAVANFDLINGTVTLKNNCIATIKPFIAGYYECVFTFLATVVVAPPLYFSTQISPTASRSQAYLGDGTSGIYIYNAQLELGSTATSPVYIDKSLEGATRTRNADGVQVALPVGVTSITLTNEADIQSVGTVADPYVIPVGKWKSIIMT